jgi:glycine hydroxymethyltransferase
VHDVRVALDDHLLGDADAADLGDASDVVAAEIDQHVVLGALLGIGDQLGGERLVLVGRRAARPRAGDRPELDAPRRQPHQRLRRRAGDLRLREAQVEHVRRRIDDAQRAVDVERVDVARHVEALRQHHLEGVAGEDVLAHALDRRLELLAGERRRRQLDLRERPGQRRFQIGQPRPRAAQPRHHLVDPCARALVRLLGLLGARHVRRRHHLQRLAQVVEDDQRVGHHHAQLGQRDARLGPRRQILERAHHVVADPPDRAAPEARQPGRLDRLEVRHHLEQGVGRIGRVPGRALGRAAAVDVEPGYVRLAALAAQHRARRDADERVRRPGRAAHHRLEQEAVLAASERGVRRHRRVAVGEQLAIHRDQVALLRGAHELLATRVVHGARFVLRLGMSADVIRAADPEIASLIAAEEQRQRDVIRLIASENYVSSAVLAASGTVLTNKYSEGYPGKRYYQGQKNVDAIEQLAIDRAKSLFGSEHANVQPYSGSPANLAVYLAFLNPGDTVMGMALPAGGHLTHGWNVSITGKFFRPVQYGVRKDTGRVDLDEVRDLARKEKPKLLFAGGTAIPRTIDFAAYAEIAKEVGAIFVADIAHIAGLVAAGVHPSPVPVADVVSTTTHKTLRGPRGGMLMCKETHAKAIDRAVFPGLQGGPHDHTTAAIAIALKEAATAEFKRYAQQIVTNARALAAGLVERGFELVTGGTDNHLILVDLTSKGVPGKQLAVALEDAGIVLNYNSVPFDTRKPFDPSGVRIGSAAVTSRGMKEPEMAQIAAWIDAVTKAPADAAAKARIAGEVKELCAKFPAPGL